MAQFDELSKTGFGDVAKQMKQLTLKLQEFEGVQANIENEIGNIQAMMRTKAGVTMVEQVKLSLEDYATKVQ